MRRYDQLESGSEPEPEPEPIPVPETDAPACSICFGDIELDDSGYSLNKEDKYLKLPCDGGHTFHEECIDKWLEDKKTCPNCRAPVETADAVTIGTKPPCCSNTSARVGECSRGCRESTGNCLRDDRTRQCETGTCCLLRTGLAGAAAHAVPCDVDGTVATACCAGIYTGLSFDNYPQTGNPCCNPNLCSEGAAQCVDPGGARRNRAPDMERGALRFKKSKKSKKTKKTKKNKIKKTKKRKKTRKKTKRKSI